MDTVDIISDLINETNQTDSEQITAEMALLDTQATRDSTSSIQEENTNDAIESEGVTQEIAAVALDDENLDPKLTRPCQFAVNRIKSIMKCDPDLALASKESVFAITKATVTLRLICFIGYCEVLN